MVTNQYITCRFSCSVCGLKHEKVQVRARRSPEEDIVKWMNYVVVRTISERHQILSFTCPAIRVEDLMIPIDKDDPEFFVGKYTPLVPRMEEEE